MLCYVTPKEHLGLPTRRRQSRRMPTGSPTHCRRLGAWLSGARDWTSPLTAARGRLSLGDQSGWARIRSPARTYHDENLPAAPETAGILQHCGPKFCFDEAEPEVIGHGAST